MSLGGYTYLWKDSVNMIVDVGVLAQEVEVVYPNAVTTDSILGTKKVYYYRLIPLLIEAIKAIKEQQQQIDKQQMLLDEYKKLINKNVKK